MPGKGWLAISTPAAVNAVSTPGASSYTIESPIHNVLVMTGKATVGATGCAADVMVGASVAMTAAASQQASARRVIGRPTLTGHDRTGPGGRVHRQRSTGEPGLPADLLKPHPLNAALARRLVSRCAEPVQSATTGPMSASAGCGAERKYRVMTRP